MPFAPQERLQAFRPNPIIARQTPSWRRVTELADLAGIFEPGVQVCSFRRPIDAGIAAYLDGVSGTGTLQELENLRPGMRARLAGLPPGMGRERLVDDVALLTEILCELLDCPLVGLRCMRIEGTMCPSWHVDRVPLRLLCTYGGPGTEWLENQGVGCDELALPGSGKLAYQRAAAGEIVLLKGALWQGNEGLGAIHRSPAVPPGTGRRTLVSLDPLWPA